MTWADGGPKLVAALVAGTLAALLLAGRRRRSARILGVFLALIAANQVLEAARALEPDAARQLLYYKLASIAAALDPPVLLWSWHAEERSRSSRLALGLGLAGSAALAVWAGWWLGSVPVVDPETHVFSATIGAFTLACYGFVLREAFARGRRPGLMGAAYAVAAVPLASRLVKEVVVLAYTPIATAYAQFVLTVFLPSVFAALLVVALLRRDVPEARLGGWLAVGILGLEVVAPLNGFLYFAGVRPFNADLEVFGRIATGVRWLLFGGLASIALFSDAGVGEMSLAARRRAARVLLGVTFTLAAASLLFVLGPFIPGAPLGATETVVLVLALAFSQSFRSVVDAAAHRAYGVPRSGDPAAAQEAYRKAAALAIAQGRPPAQDAELDRLRDELGIDAATARTLERTAEQLLAGPAAPGHVLAGRYRLDGVVGRGGAGRAFLARDLLLDRKVVVKEIARAGPEDDLAIEEARAASALAHPNLLAVHDVVRRGDYDFLVTEFAAGGDLAARIAEGVPDAAARRILADILAGLAAMHAAGIVHRDVKPQNVLLSADGRARIADFGLARRWTDETVGATFAGHFAGTPAYVAPEIRRGAAATAAADVFSVGVLAGKLFAGRVPEDLRALVEKALAEAPAERWRDAGEMLAALQGAR